MPLSAQDEAQLTNAIKIKFGLRDGTETQQKQITYILGLLNKCSGKRQAEAVLNNCDSVDDIKLLAEYGFDKIKQNSRDAITAAIAAAPAAILQRAQEKAAQDQINTHIEGYRSTISPKYKKHTAGTLTDSFPIQDGTRKLAVHYNNGDGRLPQGRSYAEWYPAVGSQNSAGKRFFTSRGLEGLWYTEHGTHNMSVAVWYRLDGTDWKQF
jgi:hypothetical protein